MSRWVILAALAAGGCDLVWGDKDDSGILVTDSGTDTGPVATVPPDCEAAAAVIAGVGYATVQDALDAAVAGDAIDVCPGVHTGGFRARVAGDLILRSASGNAADTVLDGGGGARVLMVGTSTALQLRGLTLANGYDGYSGGAVLAEEVPSLVIEECVFENNVSDYGGGAVQAYHAPGSGGAIDIRGTTFRGNVADYEGGALVLGIRWDPVYATITDCTFEDNVSGYTGGAIVASAGPGTSLEVVTSTFTRNVADYEGGAVALGGWDPLAARFIGVEFIDNSASYSGGAVALSGWAEADITLEDCVAIGNSANSGAAYQFDVAGTPANDGTVRLTGGAVLQNTSSDALCANDWWQVDVVGVDFGSGATDNPAGDVCGCGAWGAGATFTYDPGAGSYCTP